MVVAKVPVTILRGFSIRAATTVPNSWKTCFSWIVLCCAQRLHWITSSVPSRSAIRSRAEVLVAPHDPVVGDLEAGLFAQIAD